MPYWVLLGVFSVGTGMVNLFGVQLMSRLGLGLLVFGELVVWSSIVVWAARWPWTAPAWARC